MNIPTQSSSTSKASAVAKWLGLQVAAKAVSVALGAPLASALAMGALAYLQGLPLAWGFLGVILAAAGTSTMLNQARSFMLAYSVVGKINIVRAEVTSGMNLDKSKGYAITVEFKNTADISLQYYVERFSGHIDNRIIARPGRSGELSGLGGVIEPREERPFTIGMVVMALELNKELEGELEVIYRYGRLGKLNNVNTERFILAITTDDQGAVKDSRIYRTRNARMP